MAIRIQIFDGAIPMLDKIAEAHYGQGLDALDHAGTVLRDSTRHAMFSVHNWRQDFEVNKKGVLTRRIRKRGPNVLGTRRDMKTGGLATPPNMKSLITSNLMAKDMTMVVAGKHRQFTPKMRRNGQVIGVLKRVDSVSVASYAILQKLDSGETEGDYETFVRKRSDKMKRFKNAVYKKRGFIAKGRGMASGRVREIMTTKLESMIHKQVNRATVKYKEVKTS